MRFTYQPFDHRTVSEVQKNITERRGKRRVISRRLHAKDDKEAIAAWKLDLDKILHTFNVRSTTSVRPSLDLCFQAELGTNQHTTVSGTQQNAANTHTIIPTVHPNTLGPGPVAPVICINAPNTHPIVPGTNRNGSKSGGDTDGQNQVVSTARTLPVAE